MAAIVHALLCSVALRSRLISLSVSPNSDKSGQQSLYPDGNSDRHQNLIICSSGHSQPSLKISCKSVQKFLDKVADKQTNRQTNKQTHKRRRKHNLLGEDNKYIGLLAATLWWFTAAQKTPKNTSFWGHPAPRGRTAPIF